MRRLRHLLASTPVQLTLAVVIVAAFLVASQAERGETISASLVVLCVAAGLALFAFEAALYAIAAAAVRRARGCWSPHR